MPMMKSRRAVDKEEGNEKEALIKPPTELAHTEGTKEVRAEHASPTLKPYKSLVPYPHTLLKANEEHKYGKFLEMLKKFHISLPFQEAITDAPSYAKF